MKIFRKKDEVFYKHATYCLLLIALVFSFFIAPHFPLAMDEAYYWTWSRSLNLSYFDHPPLVAYLIRSATSIFGTNEFALRFWAIVLGIGSSFLISKLTTEMFESEEAGFYATLISLLIPIYAAGRLIITPDSSLGFFWSLSLYTLYKAANQDKSEWWLYSGIAIGLALLSKYTAIFIFPSFGIYLLLSPEKRRHILSFKPYLTIAIAFLLFSPVILWNWQRNWISFSFQFTHGLAETPPPGIQGFFEFLGTQFILVSPLLFSAIIASSCLFIKHWLKKRDDRFLYIASMFVPAFIFFALAATKSSPEANWPAFSYASGIIATAIIYKRFDSLKWVKGFATVALLLSFALTATIYTLSVSPILVLPKIEEVHYGWPELGKRVSEIAEEMSKVGGRPFVITNHYQLSSQLAFYMKDRPNTYVIDGYKRYEYPNPSSIKGKNAIYIEYGDGGDEKVVGFFNSIEKPEIFKTLIRGKEVRRFKIYNCYHYKGGLLSLKKPL